MKRATQSLLLVCLAAVFATAQIQPGTFKHIIIVVQENRTPDNLFGANPSGGNCSQENPFETGVDIEDGGIQYWYDSNGHLQHGLLCNIPLTLSGFDSTLNLIPSI